MEHQSCSGSTEQFAHLGLSLENRKHTGPPKCCWLFCPPSFTTSPLFILFLSVFVLLSLGLIAQLHFNYQLWNNVDPLEICLLGKSGAQQRNTGWRPNLDLPGFSVWQRKRREVRVPHPDTVSLSRLQPTSRQGKYLDRTIKKPETGNMLSSALETCQLGFAAT